MNTKMLTMALAGVFSASLAAQSTSVAAQSTADAGPRGLYDALRDSPFTFRYLNITEAMHVGRKDQDFRGYVNQNRFHLQYGLSENSAVKVQPRVYHMWNTGGESDTELNRVNLHYLHSGILERDRHGVNMGIDLEQRFNGPEVRESSRTYGRTGLGVLLDRRFGSLGLSGGYYYYVHSGEDRDFLDRRTGGTIDTSSTYAFLNQTYNFTDKWFVSFTEELLEFNRNARNRPGIKDGALDSALYTEFGYAFTPRVKATLLGSFKPFKSGDGRFFREDWTQNFNMGFTIDARMF